LPSLKPLNWKPYPQTLNAQPASNQYAASAAC